MARGNSKKSSTRKSTKSKISHLYKPDGMAVEQWQVAQRQQMAQKEVFGVKCVDNKLCPDEYLVHNPEKRNDYKMVYQGQNSEWNYCSCMDF